MAVVIALAVAAALLAPQRDFSSSSNLLRGDYGPYRANNDLLFYHLDIRVDPERKYISGRNTVRFKMLSDGQRIQLDLTDALRIDKVTMGAMELQVQRDQRAVFIDFPSTLRKGKTYEIAVHYSGSPPEVGRFGGITFRKDSAGKHWINTACEEQGASVWWPNKDQWRDEVEEMKISVAIPSDLVDVSNGKFLGKQEIGGGYTRWDWHVQYPINNYSVSLNIGDYKHFQDRVGGLPLDFWVLPEHLEKAKVQFAQTKGMMQAFQHYFGEYPFKKDGYKLIEVPYSGMEHQSAVTYGNRFANGYLGRDWTGVGVSLKFDFILIHESGHEWFGNAVSAADRADMWIHEGWTTYLECLYVEYWFGRPDALKYINGYKAKVRNREPVIPKRESNIAPPSDQYFKGALFLHTLRSVIHDDKRWFALIRGFYQAFKYKNILTEDVIAYFNRRAGADLTAIFNQYLRHANIPELQLEFAANSESQASEVRYRWKADEPGFAMPIRVGAPGAWQTVRPRTGEWQSLKTSLSKEAFTADTEHFYVTVAK